MKKLYLMGCLQLLSYYCNETQMCQESWHTLSIGLGPWRSMFYCKFILMSSFIQCFRFCQSKINRRFIYQLATCNEFFVALRLFELFLFTAIQREIEMVWEDTDGEMEMRKQMERGGEGGNEDRDIKYVQKNERQVFLRQYIDRQCQSAISSNFAS